MNARDLIRHRMCPIDHQKMNGQVERLQGLLSQKVRGLFESGNMKKMYWPLILETATFILNRTPHTSIERKTPFEKATGVPPDLSRMRKFGSTAYVQIPKLQRRGKFNSTAWKGVTVVSASDRYASSSLTANNNTVPLGSPVMQFITR